MTGRTTQEQRQHLARLMDQLVENEPKVHYAQVRPMRTGPTILNDEDLTMALASRAGITMDCSESVTLLCRLAGLMDPNGVYYDGTGYTGTLLRNLPHYTSARGASIGALVVFGPGTGHHVCMVRKPGANPLLFSHGQERGPFYISLSEEAKYQPAPVTFLSIADLG